MYEKKVQLNVRVPKSLKESVEKKHNLTDLVYYTLLYYSARIENSPVPLCMYVNNKRGAICQGGRTRKLSKNPERSCEDLCGLWSRDPAALMDYLKDLDPELEPGDIIIGSGPEQGGREEGSRETWREGPIHRDSQTGTDQPAEALQVPPGQPGPGDPGQENPYSPLIDLGGLRLVPGPGEGPGSSSSV